MVSLLCKILGVYYMKQHYLIASCAALILALPSIASACPGGGASCSVDKRSCSSAAGKSHAKYGLLSKADKNSDGKVDKAEFLQAAKDRAELHFAHMDSNGDGVLDKTDRTSHFGNIDSNNDGKISQDEFSSFQTSKGKSCKGK